MEVTQATLGFSCPNCLRRLEVSLDPETVEVTIGIEPCPVHLSHAIIGLNFACPNCSERIDFEMIDSAMPDVEDVS